jgi:large subunit ribosomal protein L1
VRVRASLGTCPDEQAAQRGQVEFRVERQGIVMAGVGKLSFPDAHLKENLRAFMIALSNAKPESIKGQYFKVRRCRRS